MTSFMDLAVQEALTGLNAGGIPIGSVLVADHKILGKGHNQRIQTGSCVLHAEMAALESAGRLTNQTYLRSTIYTTLAPCSMCTGAILLYKIPKVVVGENINFSGEVEYLRSKGVTVEVRNEKACVDMLAQYISQFPNVWYEDIGEELSISA